MSSAKILLLAIFSLTAACAPQLVPQPTESAFVAPMRTGLATAEAQTNQAVYFPYLTAQAVFPTATLSPEPAVQRTNWLLLGGDYRAHREGTGWGNKTDVIVLVSVLESDPVEISVVQFPRNLYVPTSLGDVWLFAVWDAAGWQGLHTYFQEAFGISLQGIFYVDMDSFVQIVDDLGGIRVNDSGGAYQLGGEDVLSYLRDNENNWGMGSYDAEQRVFRVLAGLWAEGSAFFLENPAAAANIVYSRWGDLFQTDLSNIKQLYWLFDLGWKVRSSEYEMRFIQLEEPFIIRGPTPIIQEENPTRGMIANTDLRDWMQDCVFDQVCEADDEKR